MIKKYTIANFNLSVDIDYDEYFIERLMPYEKDFTQNPDITFTIKRTKHLIRPNYTNLVKIGNDKYCCKVDDKDAIINFDSNTGKIIALSKFDSNYSNVSILSYDITQDYNYSCSHFNFNLMGNAMHYVMAMHSAFVIHSSSIVCNDGGVAFSAPSGTGKSTHTSLWLSQFDDVYLLNDDTPILRLDDKGEIFLCGTPWAGTTGININKSVSLKAIVFLSRAKENSMEKLSSSDALKCFFEAICTPINSRMHLNCLETIKSIFMNVPIYKLSCNMEPEAAVFAREYIFKSTK